MICRNRILDQFHNTVFAKMFNQQESNGNIIKLMELIGNIIRKDSITFPSKPVQLCSFLLYGFPPLSSIEIWYNNALCRWKVYTKDVSINRIQNEGIVQTFYFL